MQRVMSGVHRRSMVCKFDRYLKLLGDRHGEVAEPCVRVHGAGIAAVMAAKETLHLDTLDPSLGAVTEYQPSDIDEALPIEEQLQLSVRLTHVIEPHTLADLVPYADFEVESTTTDGGTVSGVALRLRLDVANVLVGSKTRGQICV